MNSTVAASIAASLATLTRVVDPPASTGLGYGVDLSCIYDLAADLAEVDPASPGAIVQAVIRRYITPRGALPDDESYGFDLRAHCNRGMAQRELRALAGMMQGEALKDDRVSEASVSLTADLLTRSLAVAVQIVPVDPALQSFAFTFSVTGSDVLQVTINNA